MATAKIKWNLPAFEEVRTSPEVNDMLQEVVYVILSEANSDAHAEDLYKGTVSEGPSRSVGRVWTAGTHAERSNAKHNTLIKALAKGGGAV